MLLLQDVRYALRTLRSAPGFTCAALLTLTLGIGANTVIFSVINTVLLSPPNFKHLDRLAIIFDVNRKAGRPDGEDTPSPGNFLDWRRQTRAFDQTVGWRNWYYSLAGPEGGRDLPESVRGVRISPSFFSMLGVDLAMGRGFQTQEETPGRDQVVILASSLWKRHFAGDPAILGRTIRIDGRPFTVVGILPAGFCFLQPDLELWMPLPVDDSFQVRNDHSLMVFARLAPGVSMAQAQSEMDSLAGSLERSYPDTNTGWGTHIVPIYPSRYFDPAARSFRSALLILSGAVALVLLIACANVANLLLARAESRRREIAIRAAIGATRGRLVRQMLTESALLAIAGSALALALSWWGLQAISHVLPRIPTYHSLAPVMDGRVFLFTLAIALFTGILFGLPPAFQATNTEALRVTATSPRGVRAGRLLMISELALSIILLVGAALLVKSLWRLESIQPGFRQDHLLTMQLWLPRTKYPDRAEIRNFYQDVVRRVDSLPGVRSAAAVNFRPFLGMGVGTALEVQGRAPRKAGEPPVIVDYRIATPGYLRALGVPFVEGRDLAESDGPDAAGAVVVNQAAARRLWPNESPIGKQVRPKLGGASPWDTQADPMHRWLTVVGVAANIKESGLNDPGRPEIYLSYQQFPSSFMFLVLRTTIPPASMAASVRNEILAVDRDQPVSDVRTMDSAIRESTAEPRLTANLLVLFVLIAIFLAAAGVYGVMSYVTTQRAQEIAIRMALGACPGDILRMVLREITLLAATAAAAGLLAAAGFSGAMRSILFEVAPLDPAIFAGASLALFAVALAACYLPARKAARVDPMTALRM